MSRRLSVSVVADADLLDAFNWIVGQGRPRTAAAHVRAVRARFALLASLPHLGRDRGDVLEGLRTYPVRGATIVYRIEPTRLRILRVLGRGRDVEAALDAF